jgi:3'-phosphoadenosine 5'-phosphosulfate (PAPS) 3'-phosphatase
MKLRSADLALMCNIARQAGDAIMEIYEGDYAVGIKDDKSPVTIADIIADQIIRKGLEKIFLEYRLFQKSRARLIMLQQKHVLFFL